MSKSARPSARSLVTTQFQETVRGSRSCSHSSTVHHAVLQGEIAARAKQEGDTAAAVAAVTAPVEPLLDLFSPWLLPGQPTRPHVVHVGPTTVEVEWELLDGGGVVSGHQIRMQVGGTGGFVVCVEDTQNDTSRVVLRRLAPGGWYEFDVASLNAHGTSAFSKPSLPVHTPLPHEPPAAVARTVESDGVSRGTSRKARTTWMTPVPGAAATSTAVPSVQQSYTYERLRRGMLQWEDNFAAAHGRQPNGADRQASGQHAVQP